MPIVKSKGVLQQRQCNRRKVMVNGTVRLFNVDYYDQHICNSDGIVHPYVVEATHDSVATASQNQSSSSMFVNTDAHGVQDESFGQSSPMLKWQGHLRLPP